MTNREGASRTGAGPKQRGIPERAAGEGGDAKPNEDAPESPFDDEELTAEQLTELRQALEERRASLISQIDERQHEERGLSREVGDEMDDATTEGTTSMTSKLLERDVRLLAEIDRALVKLNEGTYGLCEGTEEPIGYRRLRLRPWARYSVSYQEEIERAQRTGGGR